MCERCGGDREILVGGISGSLLRCNICHGSGEVRCDDCNGSGDDTESCSTCSGCGQVTFAEFDAIKCKKETEAQQRELERQRRQAEQAKRQAEDEKRRAEEYVRLQEREKQREQEAKRVEAAHIQQLQRERTARGVCILCGTCLSWLEKLSGKIQHEHCSILKMPTPVEQGDRLEHCSRCNNRVPYFITTIHDKHSPVCHTMLVCPDCGFQWRTKR